MLPTTERYKRAVIADKRWADARIAFGLYDPDAAPSATVPATGEASFSRTVQMCDTVTSMSGKWATFEPGGFPLDGSGRVPPRMNEAPEAQMGFWYDTLSDAAGNVSFSREISFSQPITGVGLTLYFDEPMGVYAVDFILKLQSGTTVLNQVTITGNAKSKVSVALPAQNYNRAVIIISKWSRPFSRVRISEMLFGIIETLTGDDNIVTLQLLTELDLTSESIPSREMAVTLQNLDRRFDQWNPGGIYKYLVDAYQMDTEIGFGETSNTIDMVYSGRDYFFMSEGANGQATARIKTRDRLFKMGSTKYRKGRLTQMTVAALLAEIFADAGVTDYTIDPALSDTTVTAALPEMTHRDAVKMLAQAGRACAYTDRNGNPVVRRIALSTPVATISGDKNAHEWPSPETEEYFNAVEVAVHNFRDPGGTSTVIAQASFPGSGTREQWITFRGAAYGATAIATSGTIVSQTAYLYGIRLTLSGGAAEITVNGRLAEHSVSNYTYDQSGDEDMLAKAIDNPLITNAAVAASVAQWRYNLLAQRLTHKVKWRGDPAIEIGDTVRFIDEYGQQRDAIIAKNEIYYDGTVYQLTQAKGGWQ